MALFDDLVQGFKDLKNEREGKTTLKEQQVYTSNVQKIFTVKIKDARSI